MHGMKNNSRCHLVMAKPLSSIGCSRLIYICSFWSNYVVAENCLLPLFDSVLISVTRRLLRKPSSPS